MSYESLRIFDPRRNFQLQGFTGRGATTTIHDASATGVSISGIFQAAEDFAVLGFYNAYDYFNHLRLKHLPRTDLSGLTLAFDIEYDHALDGAMRLDAAKYPSVSWDSMTFECGVGGAANTYEVRLLDHATVVSGGETPAAVNLDIDGEENLDGGIDWLHLYFRDTRYTVTSTDARVETQLSADVAAGDMSLPVDDVTGFGNLRHDLARTHRHQRGADHRRGSRRDHRGQRIDGAPQRVVRHPEDDGVAHGAEARGHHQHGGRDALPADSVRTRAA